MSWLFLALLAPSFDTMINFVDKYLIEQKVKDSHSMPIYSGIATLVFGTGAWLVAGMPALSPRNALLVIASGAVAMLGFAFYFHALAKSQTSYVTALLQTTPIFILTLSSLLLGEKLTTVQFLGFSLVLAAILGLSIDKVERKIKLDKAFFQIMAGNLLFAVSFILIKYTVDLKGFVNIMVYESWGLAIGGLALFLTFKRARTAFLKSFSKVGRSTLTIMFFTESLFAIAQAVTLLAISLGPVALVGVLAGTQVFYAILYGTILTLLFPDIFHEDIAKKDIAAKLAFSLILFAGVWLIGSA